ncbi:MAG: DUF2723 domain-containing protein [Patescibacteria group bacterium]
MLKFNKLIKNDIIIAGLIFIISLVVYIITLAPTVTAEDSGEFIAGAYTLSVIHSPGYPLYCLLGKLFSFIPIGSVAWRINFMSAFFGAATVAFLFIYLQKTIRHEHKRIMGIIAAFCLAFSQTFWSQAVIAEVYTLNAFFIILMLLIIALWQDNKKYKYLFWLAFIYGLGIANHQSMVIMAPVIILYLVLIDIRLFLRWRLLLGMFLFFIIGLLPFIYLPIRSAAQPYINLNNPQTFDNFIYHVGRSQYNEDLGMTIFKPEDYSAKILYIQDFFIKHLPSQFGWYFLWLVILGIVFLWRRQRKILYIQAAIFLLFSVGLIINVYNQYSDADSFVMRVFFIPCYISASIFLAVGILWFYDISKKYKKHVLYGFLVVPVIILCTNFTFNNNHTNYFNYDYAHNVLTGLEPNAILLTGSDNLTSGIWYLQAVEKYRTDVKLIIFSTLFTSTNIDVWAEKYPEIMDWSQIPRDHEISVADYLSTYYTGFLNSGLSLYLEPSFTYVPNNYYAKLIPEGALYKVDVDYNMGDLSSYAAKQNNIVNNWAYHRNTNSALLQNNFFNEAIVKSAIIAYQRSAYVSAASDDYESAINYLKQAGELFSDNSDLKIIESDFNYLQALSIDANNFDNHYNFALSLTDNRIPIETILSVKELEKCLILTDSETVKADISLILKKMYNSLYL